MDPSKNSWPEPQGERREELVRFMTQWELPCERLELFDQALTHSSYAYENSLPGDNERMEFFGDTVIGLYVADWLFETFPDEDEGLLSKRKANLVSRRVLGRRARAMHIADVLRLGKGEAQNAGRGRISILGSAQEALVGAAYIAFGAEQAKRYVLDHIVLPCADWGEMEDQQDFKSTLQEKVQRHCHMSPRYQTVGEIGPDHEKRFVVQVKIQGKVCGRGEGRKKKSAENAAAKSALECYLVENG